MCEDRSEHVRSSAFGSALAGVENRSTAGGQLKGEKLPGQRYVHDSGRSFVLPRRIRSIYQLIAGTNREFSLPMNVGEELRQARLSRGLTLEQISGATRVSETQLERIERNNVVGMPLVYVRRDVREFARALGLDPDNLTERYIAQFATTTSARTLPDLAEMAEDEADLPDLEEPLTAAPATRSSSEGSIAADYRLRDDDFDSPPPPIEFRSSRLRRGQWAALVPGTIAAAAIGFMIGSYTYRQASRAVAEEQVAERPIDAERASGTTNDTARTPATPANVPEAPASRDGASTATPPRDSVATTTTDLARADLDGTWTMTNEVRDSSLKTFRGLRLQYRLQLQQDGPRVTGNGQKVSENGRALRKSARTPITLAGTVEKDKVQLTFREKGRRRESGGTFQFQLAEDGSLRGSFESDAARSSGQSVVRRVP